MEIAYLGLFEKVFNWVLSRIFDPIFKWLSNLLTTVLTWVFEKVLEPILLPILETVMEFAFELFMDIFSTLIYGVFSGLLKLIDYMETAFDVFIGLRDVSYVQNGKVITGSLLEVLLQQDTINTIFWAFTLAGLGIALMLTIYATAKSSFDLDFENKRPVSKVLSSMMRTFILFFTVPFLMYFVIQLATAILEGATYVLKGGNNTTLGRIVFMIASLDAVDLSKKDAAKYNISTAGSNITLGTDIADKYRYPFYSLDASSPKDYGDMKVVMESFDLSNFDYFIGFLAGIFLFIVIAMCLLTFVQRIFEVILLYAVSPYFVSMIPLDEGERFGRWRDMFISKVLTGYGSAIAMRLYLLVCPMIMGNNIKFGLYVSTEMDYMMKLFFLLGGAWAVYKCGPMLTALFSSSGAQRETAVQDMVGGFFYGKTIGKMLSGNSKGGRGSAVQAMPEQTAGKEGNGDGSESAMTMTKFTGTKTTGADTASKSVLKDVQPKDVQAKGAQVKDVQAKDVQAKGAQVKDVQAKDVQAKGAQVKDVQAKGNDEKYKSISGVKPEGELPKQTVTIGDNTEPIQNLDTGKTDAKREHNSVRLGSLFSSTYDADGNHKIRVLGYGITKDGNGNTTAVRLPGVKLRKLSPDGGYKVSRLNLPGSVKVRSKVINGELKYTDISLRGMYYKNKGDGFKLGYKDKFSYKETKDGVRVNVGNSFSVETDQHEKRISQLRMGSLLYNRNGSIEKVKDEKESGGDKA